MVVFRVSKIFRQATTTKVSGLGLWTFNGEVGPLVMSKSKALATPVAYKYGGAVGMAMSVLGNNGGVKQLGFCRNYGTGGSRKKDDDSEMELEIKTPDGAGGSGKKGSSEDSEVKIKVEKPAGDGGSGKKEGGSSSKQEESGGSKNGKSKKTYFQRSKDWLSKRKFMLSTKQVMLKFRGEKVVEDEDNNQTNNNARFLIPSRISTIEKDGVMSYRIPMAGFNKSEISPPSVIGRRMIVEGKRPAPTTDQVKHVKAEITLPEPYGEFKMEDFKLEFDRTQSEVVVYLNNYKNKKLELKFEEDEE